ncbi:MAG: tripartite tricarboxylate transporter substrate binding protein [Betaproteobacteria bacterium]|nr:tripartite tricarboxylate transporter substrate binding protein [Betaproteobacteria bacterium]
MRIFTIGLVLWAGFAVAQTYPAKPVRWIVPTGPGSAVDVNARRVAPRLSEALGQPVIVDNRPGANSMIGAREAARAAPDGYTLFQAVVNNALNDLLTPDPCCILNDKLIAVTRLYTTPLVMVVHPSVAANNLREYVALARAQPQMLTYASGGNGAITQMVGELLKVTAGIQLREIPYKAIGAEVPDLIGGHVLTAFLSPVVIRDHVRSGKLRGIAVAARERLAILPDVPTTAEAGFPGVEGSGWNGIFVPAGTPPAIVVRLQHEIAKVLVSKEVLDDALTLGTQAGGEKPEEFAAFVRAELQKWGKLVKDAGIKIQ